mmetsp:Transcript_15551/g.26352  ORF Transcript_15551/g.26352 Transcript_15551/m.26352 type:complete len:273 (-) Transcript_15551:665-1483(-)
MGIPGIPGNPAAIGGRMGIIGRMFGGIIPTPPGNIPGTGMTCWPPLGPLPPFPLPFPFPSPLPAFPPFPSPSERSPLLLLSESITFIGFPSTSCPFNVSMAFCASSLLEITTKPTPRCFLVSSSQFKITALNSPKGSKSSRSLSAVTSSDKFRMHIRTPALPLLSPFPDELRFFRSSSNSALRSARLCARCTCNKCAGVSLADFSSFSSSSCASSACFSSGSRRSFKCKASTAALAQSGSFKFTKANLFPSSVFNKTEETTSPNSLKTELIF